MKTKIVYSEKCLGYGAGHIEGPERVKSAVQILKDRGYVFCEPQPATEEDLLTVHDPDYLWRLKQGIVEDEDTPAYNNIYEYAKLSVGGALLASKTNAFCLMRPPGHHVGKSGIALGASTRGFCYLNNMAIAVKKLGRKTLILDIDGHHGNGTQEIFQSDKKVTYVSIHQSPNFPGTGATTNNNYVNFSLPPDVGSEKYTKTLDEALRMVNHDRVDVVAVSCGFDTHKGDLASLGLTEKDYRIIGKKIGHLNKPAFFVLEGGYVGQQVGLDIDSLLKGYEENK